MSGFRLGVLSDTHGNLEYLQRTVEFLICFEPDMICHLGDNYEDADLIEAKGIPLHRVPGIYSPLYMENRAPRKLRVQLARGNMVLVHSPADLEEDDYRQADLVLYGHTHKYELRSAEKTLILNPGHLKASLHKGREASFALVEMGEGRTRATVYSFQMLAEIESLTLEA